MKKAIIAALTTAFAGWFFADWCYQLPEIGSVIAVAVMGGFIIYFNEENSLYLLRICRVGLIKTTQASAWVFSCNKYF